MAQPITWGDAFAEVEAASTPPMTTAETCAALFGILREAMDEQRAALIQQAA